MKRKLRIICSVVLTGFSFLLTGCNAFITSTKITDPVLPEKIKYDISYYENLKKETLKYIKETSSLIQEIKNSADQYENALEYESAIDEMTLELLIYGSNINEYDYQILLLQSSGVFNNKQQLLATKLLESKITSLNKQLVLKEKHFDYYQEYDFEKIKNAIEETNQVLQSFLEKEVNYASPFTKQLFQVF